MSTDESAQRRAELIAAAVAGSLAPEEETEYAALAAADPSVADEVAELTALLARVSSARPEPAPVLAVAPSSTPTPPGTAGHPDRVPGGLRTRGRAPVAVAAAVAGVLGLGLGAVLGVVAAGDGSPAPTESAPVGPPGTLGATEPIAFVGAPDGVRIDAALVAHTWGTETVLEMEGFPSGRAYEVVLLDAGGRVVSSGSFRGSTVPIDCRLNAAWLRERVEAVEIRDGRGRVVAASDVPTVTPDDAAG